MSQSLTDDASIHAFRSVLLAWFDRHARKLPWRAEHRDAYHVWVSEIMLQQTRVATVIPYYIRFLKRFPTCQNLADASLDEVLALWSGLGYYRRARALHQAARQIMQLSAKRLPSDPVQLRKLAGIGPYTAAAIASIAHNYPVAVVDGNVIRVISRLFAYSKPIDTPAAVSYMRDMAQHLLDPGNPGKYNEAMMELGALQCTPWTPNCSTCPVVNYCRAFSDCLTDQLPKSQGKKAVELVHLNAHVVTSSLGVLLAQRASHGLFGGMWEPPMEVRKKEQTLEEQTADTGNSSVEAWLANNFAKVKPRIIRGAVRHVLSHRILQLRVFRWDLQAAPSDLHGIAAGYQQARWVRLDDKQSIRPGIGISSLVRKTLLHASVDPGDNSR